MPAAPVNKIIPFSMVDGPGSRTSVFLQGCNIRCAYCHNPETQKLCNACGACVKACPAGALSMQDGRVLWNSEKCIGCDTCIKLCENCSSPRVKWMEAADVFSQIEKNLVFVRGITVSGGECMLYPDFIEELFLLAKSRGLHTLIDSNGTVRFSEFPGLTRACDGVMLDVKSWDPGIFGSLTGASNKAVKENLVYLAEENRLEEIRIVCLEGYVDAKAAVRGIAGLLGEKTAEQKLKLIRFRKYGVRGALADRPSPSTAVMESIQDEALAAGFTNIRII